MNNYRRSFGDKVFDTINYIIMIFLMFIMIYPMLNVLAISFSNKDFVMLGQVSWFPKGFTTAAYKNIFSQSLIWKAYRNTIMYAAGNVIINLTLTSMIAYTLAVDEFMFKKSITIFLTITMFFGGGLIPTYLLIKKLHMINTYWVMVIPGSVSAFNVVIYRTFFQGIGKELRESALIDGANDIKILFRIYMPLSKALLATFTLFTIVGTWNSWFNALIYLTDENRHPLQMILRRLLFVMEFSSKESEMAIGDMMQQVTPRTIRMAAVVVVMFPVLIVYPFLQKYFVKGVMIGSIKG